MRDLVIAEDYAAMCEYAATQIAAVVQEKPDAVLGLATGATSRGVYASLVRRFERGEIDFARVTCFNLDEYYPMSAASPHSYHHFMQTHLFAHINCRQWLVPDGRPRSLEEIAQACQDYEAKIADAGGIDLQLLGIGRTGHIGFNEPGSDPSSRTRRVMLAPMTRRDAAPSFDGLEFVPREAITMGIGTILDARALLLLASGTGKAEIVRTVWTGDVDTQLPASLVRVHPHLTVCLDTEASQLLPVLETVQKVPA